MKDHVEIGHLTKYDAFRVNRDQVVDRRDFHLRFLQIVGA